ncbi:MAG TPA: response regulator [Candidatus Paceibacterota bacterium]|nr:response regulator [Candidatus Paceibacterota bacterium]
MIKLNKKILILVVEDEEIQARVLTEKLVEEGFNVIQALDGQEGLALALAEHPDLILLDLVMPKMDGLTMLKKLREDSWGGKALVMILTNISDPAKVSEGLDANLGGTYEYLIKTNWSLDDVVARIKQKLEINT